MPDGFDKHYRLFHEVSVQAKTAFETGDWAGLQQLQRDRIVHCDERVREASVILEDGYDAEDIDDGIWCQIKLRFIGLLTNHHQPECIGTFFNSVYTRILHRSYSNDDFTFVRLAILTEYIENGEPPTKPMYRVYYPGARDGLGACFERIVHNSQFNTPSEDLECDIGYAVHAVGEHFGDLYITSNFQIHMLSSLFFRNKTTYIIGRVINSDKTFPLAVLILRNAAGQLLLDTVLLRQEQLLIPFLPTHSHLMVDMEIPSAYVIFPRDLMPRKPRAEIYTSLGLQKQGKNFFYRDFPHHLRYSSDKFIITPGIKGLVMPVFTLPSYPYVFKVIEDYLSPPKKTTRELTKSKYQPAKRHDRVGHMIDTLKYSDVAFPLSRFDDDLIKELEKHALSMVEYQRSGDGGEKIAIRHAYIERRMAPLNIWLHEGTDAQVEHGIIEYGNTIKEFIAANIFPGDILYKNPGVTHHGRAVLYDYDEIEYPTDCSIRIVPEPRIEEGEMSGEVWYNVGPHDIFPEAYRMFLLGDPRVHEASLKYHADFFEISMWQGYKKCLLSGQMHDFYVYDAIERSVNHYGVSVSDNATQDNTTLQCVAT